MKKLLAVASLLLAASLATASAETWPQRPVRVIVGFSPGGPTDLVARLIGQDDQGRRAQGGVVRRLCDRSISGRFGAADAARIEPRSACQMLLHLAEFQ